MRVLAKAPRRKNNFAPWRLCETQTPYFCATKFWNMEYRIEKDTMGEVKVPADAIYGAQTQRSIENFKIAQDINPMPKEIIRAFAYLKKAAALTNYEAGVLPKEQCDLIGKVCDEILEGKLDDAFPLV